ncbi:polyketide cyclase/dehydrase [Streptomyces sp. NPDC091271]|uniref:polyketide cyclase/dehydrase n=1 Tax=Streptomyces sp. NPDC091271 TaxID=3365980 RepID=UPI0038171AE3
MAAVTLRAEGRAAAEDVWLRYVTPARWPSWSPQIRAVRVNDEWIRPGTRGEIVSLFGVTAAFVVESVDEERWRWAWRVRLGPVLLRLRHEVLRLPGCTATTLRIEGPAVAVAAYAGPARWALGRLLRG